MDAHKLFKFLFYFFAALIILNMLFSVAVFVFSGTLLAFLIYIFG